MSVFYRTSPRTGVSLGCFGIALLSIPVILVLGGIAYVAIAVAQAVAPLVKPALLLALVAFAAWLSPSFYRGFRAAYDDSSTAGWVGVIGWWAFCLGCWVLASWVV